MKVSSHDGGLRLAYTLHHWSQVHTNTLSISCVSLEFLPDHAKEAKGGLGYKEQLGHKKTTESL